MRYLMKCGHVANAKDENGTIMCGICDCKEIQCECHDSEGLKGRMAICSQHKGFSNTPVPSKWELPFFKYQPDKPYDSYYCGCWGWD